MTKPPISSKKLNEDNDGVKKSKKPKSKTNKANLRPFSARTFFDYGAEP